MSLNITPIDMVIPESNIIVFSPHYDDFLFMLGGYALELKKAGKLHLKNISIQIIFSRSNYLAGTENENFNKSIDRIKLATGKRIIEDVECIDEVLGEFSYNYELAGEKECFARGKTYAESEMEFPHGMFGDFDHLDKEIFERMKERILKYSFLEDTALVFPIAFKEHIDHFIMREAAISVAKDLGVQNKAAFYFQEDKPYGGIASHVETKRIESFIELYKLESRSYYFDPEQIIFLAFKHYISQVEEVYRKGILLRSEHLQKLLISKYPCDRIYFLNSKNLVQKKYHESKLIEKGIS